MISPLATRLLFVICHRREKLSRANTVMINSLEVWLSNLPEENGATPYFEGYQ